MSWSRERHHDVSILIGLDGRVRGVEPLSKVSMMTMRPPQHGHVGRDVGGSSARVSAWSGLSGCARTPSRSRARARFSARAIGEQAVVTDAVEAAGQHVDEEAADELVGRQCHDLLPVPALGAVVLPPEDDAGVVAGDEAAAATRSTPASP